MKIELENKLIKMPKKFKGAETRLVVKGGMGGRGIIGISNSFLANPDWKIQAITLHIKKRKKRFKGF